jgi:hypothetical protein
MCPRRCVLGANPRDSFLWWISVGSGVCHLRWWWLTPVTGNTPPSLRAWRIESFLTYAGWRAPSGCACPRRSWQLRRPERHHTGGGGSLPRSGLSSLHGRGSDRLPAAGGVANGELEGGDQGDSLGKQMVALRAHRATGSPRHSTTHDERVLTAQEGWLIAQRPLRPAEGEDLPDEEELNYYYSSLEAGVSLERLASLAKSRWAIEQFYEDAKGECGLGDFQGRRWEGLHPHLALSMLAYSFLMLHSSVLGKDPPHEEEAFSPLGGSQAHDAASDSPAGIDVVVGRPGALVHRNRQDKELPSS